MSEINDDELKKIEFDKALLMAIESGEVEQVKGVLTGIEESAIVLDTKDYLAKSIKGGKVEVISLLISNPQFPITAQCWWAAEQAHSHVAVWRELLGHVDKHPQGLNFELIYSSEEDAQYLETAKNLYVKHKTVNLWKRSVWSAIERGDTDNVENIIKYSSGKKPDILSEQFLEKALIYSITQGSLPILKYFLHKGVKIKPTSPALRIAKNHGWNDIVSFLLKSYGGDYFIDKGRRRANKFNIKKKLLSCFLMPDKHKKVMEKNSKLLSKSLCAKNDLAFFALQTDNSSVLDTIVNEIGVTFYEWWNFDSFSTKAKELLLKNLNTDVDLFYYLPNEINDAKLKKAIQSRFTEPDFLIRKTIYSYIKEGCAEMIDSIYRYQGEGSAHSYINSDDFLVTQLKFSALHTSNIEVFKYFFDKCSHINLKSKNSYCPMEYCMFLASFSNNQKVLDFLIPLIDFKDYVNFKPESRYYWAIYHKNEKMINLCEANGWKVQKEFIFWLLSNHEKDDMELRLAAIEYCLKNKTHKSFHFNDLPNAIYYKNKKMVTLLLDFGANVHAKDDIAFKRTSALSSPLKEEILDMLMEKSRKEPSDYGLGAGIQERLKIQWQKMQLEKIMRIYPDTDGDSANKNLGMKIKI